MRAGFHIDGPLAAAMADAKRGLERGQGPPTRSAEIRPETWDELEAKIVEGTEVLTRDPDAPRGGLHCWGVGTGWLMREMELALLDLHVDTVKVNDHDGSVTLKVATSKTDPRGRGASRTMACTCLGRRLPSCPACSARVLLELAVGTWPGDRGSEAARGIPLIGTVADPRAFVTKAAVIRAAQADATILSRLGLLHVPPAEVTGHFMRRSGAKNLARRGCPLARVQWIGRWGSAAVLAYVEEAAEESPAGLVPVGGSWDEVRGDLATAFRAAPEGPAPIDLASFLARPEIRDAVAQGGATDRRIEALELFASSAGREIGDVSALARELDCLVRPAVVLNTQTRVLHRAVRAERLDPRTSSTFCGWQWALSTRSRPMGPEEVEEAGVRGWTWCPRCRAPEQVG